MKLILRIFGKHRRGLLLGLGSLLAGVAVTRAHANHRHAPLDAGPIIEEPTFAHRVRSMIDRTAPRKRKPKNGGGGAGGLRTPADQASTGRANRKSRVTEPEPPPVERRDVTKDVARQMEEAKQNEQQRQTRSRDTGGPDFGIGRGFRPRH